MESTAFGFVKILRSILGPARKLDLWLIFAFNHRLKMTLIKPRSGAYGEFLCLSVLINVIPDGYPFCFERVFVTVGGKEFDASQAGQPSYSIARHAAVTLDPRKEEYRGKAIFHNVVFPPGVGMRTIDLNETMRSPDALKGSFYFHLDENAGSEGVSGVLTVQTGVKTANLRFHVPRVMDPVDYEASADP